MKYKIVAVFILCLLIYSCSFTNNNKNDKLEKEKWDIELLIIKEQAEKYIATQQSRILTIYDLECTFWVSVNRLSERNIRWDFAFLNDNSVLLFECYEENIRYPRYLISYSIKDNLINFTEKLICYMEDAYLFIGNEIDGYEKFRLDGIIDSF
jgi:hypothetical protein